MSPEYFKHFPNIMNVPLLLFTLHHYIINIYLHYTPNLISKHPRHHPLMGNPSILQAKWHNDVVIISIERNECCLFLILGSQGNLMVTLKSIKETHPWVSVCCIYQLINLWYREGVFQACSIQISKVYTYPPFLVLLFYHHSVH